MQCLENKVETDYHCLGVVVHTCEPKPLELKARGQDQVVFVYVVSSKSALAAWDFASKIEKGRVKRRNQRRRKREKEKNMSEARTLLFKLKSGHVLLTKAFPLCLAWLALFFHKKKWFLIIPMFTCVRHLVQCFTGSTGHIHLIA